MWSPPEGEAKHGRYNSVGVSTLYCCDKIEGIPEELHPLPDEAIDIARIRVKESFKVFNIDNILKGFEGFFAVPNIESRLVKKEYLITNFVGACAADVGFRGVKYRGVGTGDYINYALFNYGDAHLEVISGVHSHRYKATYTKK
jgi:hypothetical protein